MDFSFDSGEILAISFASARSTSACRLPDSWTIQPSVHFNQWPRPGQLLKTACISAARYYIVLDCGVEDIY
jgi:hypothetical protein